MAASLIESMTEDFDPDAYHDNYREALQEVVDAKVEGREVIQPEGVSAVTEPTSLADALKASLAAAQRAPARAGEIETEVEAAPGRAIAGGTRTRATPAGRTGASGAKDGRARASGAKDDGARASGAKDDGAKTSRAKTGGAKTSGAKDGEAEDGTSGTPAAKSARQPAAEQPAKEAEAASTSTQPRSRRRAS